MGRGDRLGLARALMRAALEQLASAGTIRSATDRAA
jgi:ribosomal protein S18 acetylase RimI-like enzyme